VNQAARESYKLYALAGALLLGGPPAHYLALNHYPLRPESLTLVVLAALTGALLALAARRIDGIAGSVVFGLLLFAFVDLQANAEAYVPFLVLPVICLVLAFVFRAHRATLTSITLSVFYLAAVPGWVRAANDARAPDLASARAKGPVLVHLILDEMWGIGGLRAVGDTGTAAFLEDFYLQRGFSLYPAAYSRWRQTTSSIPRTLSLDQPPALDTAAAGAAWITRHYQLINNPYFATLRQSGYKLRIYQSTYIDYCRAARPALLSCNVAPANSIANIAHLEGPWTRRALLAGRFLVNVTSRTYRNLGKDGNVWRRSVAGGAFGLLDQMAADVRADSGAAVAYFAHLLTPHRPLEVDAACELYPDLSRYTETGARGDNERRWRTILYRYGQQVRCTHSRIATLFAAIDSTGGFENAIIIVHGDHGARILRRGSVLGRLRDLDRSELNSSFSTLLAVKLPGASAAVHPHPVPIQNYVAALAKSRFRPVADHSWPNFVQLLNSDGALGDTMRVLRLDEMSWTQALARAQPKAANSPSR